MSGTEAVNAPVSGEVAPTGSPAPASSSTPEVQAPASEVVAPAEPDDYSDLAGLDPKWAKEVRDLRKEAASRRVALKPFEEAFEPYSPEERDVWFGLARLTAQDPIAGAKALAELAKAIEEGETPEQAAATAGITPADADKPLTKAELDTYMAEQKKEAEIGIRQQEIEAKAVAAGYKPGTVAYKSLLMRAMDEHNYDLDAAIVADAAEKEKYAEGIIAKKLASGEKWPVTPAPTGSGAPSGEEQPKEYDFKVARNRLMARLGAKVGQ